VFVASQVKDFHNALPDGLPIECLFYRNAFAVRGFRAVQLSNHIAQLVYVTHG
jgi:hypothetical protein